MSARVGYADFLARKSPTDTPTGIEADATAIHPRLFDFQRDIVLWALRRGRAAIFADTGLGKSGIELEWARHTPGRTLLLAPLAVAEQTIREAAHLGLASPQIRQCGDQSEVGDAKIVVTNYEKLHRFDPSAFSGVVLDESSILKSFDGKTRTTIIESFAKTPYKLACTATPAPNDHMELGNHAEFVGAMSRTEMLSTFFVHDGGDTSKWRLKGHARRDFWRWVCSWAVAIRHPRDLGYEQNGYDLPPMRVSGHVVPVDVARAREGALFAFDANTLEEQRRERRATIGERVARAVEIVSREPDEQWLIWCDLNAESEALAAAIPGAVQVTGSDPPEKKVATMTAFASGDVRSIVSKPSICGFGMNWQHCARMAFVGVGHSYEAFYQATRRCHRFGQSRPVDVHVITASTEGRVVESLKRKAAEAEEMMAQMLANMGEINAANVKGISMMRDDYSTKRMEVPTWLR